METVKPKILLCEDDTNLGMVLKNYLELNDYDVTLERDGRLGLAAFQREKFDLCLLDIMMPVKDGFTVAKKIRQQSDVIPIIFISTRALIDDKIEGYNRGADDYIVKPFNMRELLMKMEVFLRRTRKLFSEMKSDFKMGTIFFSHSDLKFESPKGTIKLKQKEADLLQFLCMHPNKILKRDEILLAVWGKDDYFLGRSMDVFMSKIRKYLKADPQVVLETIHGLGYRFSVPE